MNDNYTRLTVNLPQRSMNAIDILAARGNSTKTEAIAAALDIAQYLADRTAGGDIVLVGRGDFFTHVSWPDYVK